MLRVFFVFAAAQNPRALPNDPPVQAVVSMVGDWRPGAAHIEVTVRTVENDDMSVVLWFTERDDLAALARRFADEYGTTATDALRSEMRAALARGPPPPLRDAAAPLADTPRVVLLHVPKTAGTALKHALARLGVRNAAHCRSTPEPWRALGFGTVASAREPGDRFLSAFYHLRPGLRGAGLPFRDPSADRAGEASTHRAPHVGRFADHVALCAAHRNASHDDHAAARYLLDGWRGAARVGDRREAPGRCNLCEARDDADAAARRAPKPEPGTVRECGRLYHFAPQTAFLGAAPWDARVDFLLDHAHLERDLAHLTRALGRGVADADVRLPSKGRPPRAALGPECEAVVADVYADDVAAYAEFSRRRTGASEERRPEL